MPSFEEMIEKMETVTHLCCVSFYTHDICYCYNHSYAKACLKAKAEMERKIPRALECVKKTGSMHHIDHDS